MSMQLQTRQKVQNWARRLPLLFIAVSLLALLGWGVTHVVAPQAMPTLYGYASTYLGLVFFLLMLSLDSEVDPIKVDHFNGKTALKSVLLTMLGIAINVPLMIAVYINESIGFAPIIGAMAGIAAGRCLQSVLMPLYADARRAKLLCEFEGLHGAYIWGTEAPLPEAQQLLVDKVEAEGLTMPLEALLEIVEAFDDFLEALDEAETENT